ncbi:hypothetical protein G9A89_001896 [Geosiphon pyriformis]|nr:hypothetical protein G9A89_001896 [Geosiphon pyriformis]
MSQARPYWNDHIAAWSKRCVFLFLFFIAWRVVYNMVVKDYVSNKKKEKKKKKGKGKEKEKSYKHSDLKYFWNLLKECIATTWFYMKKVCANVLDETIKETIQVQELVIRQNIKTQKLGQPVKHRL